MAKVEYDVSTKYKGVRKRKGQKTWNARYSVTLPNKVVVTGELTGYKTAKEAYDARIRKIAEIKASGKPPIKKVKLYSEVYKEYKAQCTDSAVSTLRKYDSLFKNHLNPVFGNMEISEIRTADIEVFFKKIGGMVTEKKYNKPTYYSNEYLHGIRKLNNNIFSFAYKREYITKNPTDDVSKQIYEKMGIAKEEGKYITGEQASIIFERLKSTDLQPAAYIAYHTGMRIAEVFGLLWSDIDLAKGVISVNKQMINYEGMWCLAKLKTKAAERTIQISEELKTYLQILYATQEARKNELGAAYHRNHVGKMIDNHECQLLRNDLPFVNVKQNGAMLTPASFKSAGIIIKNMGIDISFHDFRHTHITDCINKGMPADVLKARVGHEKITTTMEFYKRCTDIDRSYEREIINKIHVPSIDCVAEQQKLRDHYMEDDCWNNSTETVSSPSKLTTEELLGGSFNHKGFVPRID